MTASPLRPTGQPFWGLGDIGVLPSLPVMEGKAAILAEFVDVSGVPIDEDQGRDTFVEAVVRIAASFGAIQLEDVAAPACFEIEEKLRARCLIFPCSMMTSTGRPLSFWRLSSIRSS